MGDSTISTEDVRATIARLSAHHSESLAGLSRMLGRNDAYLQQFVKRGSPAKLDEDDRLMLAKYFQIDERLLGAREPWTPAARRDKQR